jgi:DNA replication protein DnaC
LLERWDKSAKVSYDRRVLNELVSLRFVEDHRNVVILGPVGVVKTFPGSGGQRKQQVITARSK